MMFFFPILLPIDGIGTQVSAAESQAFQAKMCACLALTFVIECFCCCFVSSGKGQRFFDISFDSIISPRKVQYCQFLLNRCLYMVKHVCQERLLGSRQTI